jgi:hypothetical protein
MFEQRSYSGESFRPKPLIEQPDQDTLVVLTPWGPSEFAAQAMGSIRDFLEMSKEAEATVVGSINQALSPFANRMRSAAVMANENLYLHANKNEYVAAVEFVAVSREVDRVSWVHIGSPHLFLHNSMGMQPLCYSLDWAWQINQQSPLLCQGLGLDRSVNLNCGSYKITEPSNIIMIGRSVVPSALYQMQNPDLQNLSKLLIEDNSNLPFWLGVLSLT